MIMASSICKKLSPFKIRQLAVHFSSRRVQPEEEDNLTQFEKDELPRADRKVHGEPYPEWRRPWTELKGEWFSKFKVFGENSTFNTRILGFMGRCERMTVQEWRRMKKEDKEVLDQSYIPERHAALGNNLATAHFVCHRGGKVKFIGAPDWVMKTKDEETPLPGRYVQKLILEKVDCENFHNEGLRYEGLDNFIGLNGLKWLSFKGNKHINDWGLDRITRITHKTVEYLDISDCSITHRGLVALYRMSSLKFLTVSGEQNTPEIEQVCTMLEEIYPQLLVKII